MSQVSKLVRLENYRPTPFLIDHVHMTFRLDPAATIVTTTLSIKVRDEEQAGLPLVLDGDELQLVSVKVDGKDVPKDAYKASPSKFTLPKPPTSPFQLELVTQLNPDQNTQLMGLYRSSGSYCTQCEAEGFRRITYFYDRPDILSVYTVRLEAPVSVPFLLSNGNPIEEGEMPPPANTLSNEAWHFSVWHDPFPKPSYLFAVVAGDLSRVEDQFTTQSGRTVALHIYVEHGKEDRVAYAMDALKRSMRWDEEVYGLEYDLDIFMIVAVSDFNMGAMENKGLNIFNDKYVLAKPDTATDNDYALIEAVIAHEYFHNWTGNRITCRDWFQLCLKEGLTVYRDQEFSSDMRSRPVKRISDVQLLRARQFPEDSGPLAHPVRPEAYSEINNFYTATVYEKGAEICRMLECVLGPSGFKKGLDLYFKRFDGQAVTIEDFLAAFEEACSIDLAQFALWYSQAGTPDLVATYSHDALRRELTLSIEQNCPPTPGQPTKKVMQIPIKFGLVGRNGEKVSFDQVRDRRSAKVVGGSDCSMLTLSERQHLFVFDGVTSAAVPSLLRGFSAPAHLRSNLTLDDHLTLLEHDDDAFNRWESAQYVLTDHLVKACRPSNDLVDGKKDVPSSLVHAIGASLKNEQLEHALRAQLLNVPSEADIAREFSRNVNPETIFKARQHLKSTLANALYDELVRIHRSLASQESFSPDSGAAGRRALRNSVLDLLLAGTNIDATQIAHTQYVEASNMTDRFAALASLTLQRPGDAETLLSDFYDRHKDDALVIDKWLSLQASKPADGTIDHIKSLMQTSAFAMSNPNRVRALIGSFAMNNALQFNRVDGAGFALVADVIISLDSSNPQTAARLANNFRSWKALEPDRQNAAKMELVRIKEQRNLSKDVSDIVNRCLQ